MKVPAASPFERGLSRWVYRRRAMRAAAAVSGVLAGMVARPLDAVRPRRSVRRAAIVKLDHIGDLITAQPALESIRRSLADVELDFIVNPAAAEVVPLLDVKFNRIISWDAPWIRHGGGMRLGVADLARTVRRLRQGDYDLFIDLRGDPVMIISAFTAGIPERVGFGWGGLSGLLNRAFYAEPGVHISRIWFQVARHFDSGAEYHPPRVVVPLSAAAAAEEFLSLAGAASARLVGVHVGAGVSARRWHPELFRELSVRLIDCLGVTILWLGDQGDRQRAEPVLDGAPLGVVPAFGLPLAQVAALTKRLHLMVAGNSALGHLAAACGVPVVSVFSAANHSERWKPYARRGAVVKAEVPCWGCALQTCPLPKSCLDRISPEVVLAAVVEMWKSFDGE